MFTRFLARTLRSGTSSTSRPARNCRRSRQYRAATLKLRFEPLDDRHLLAFGDVGDGGVVTTNLLATPDDWIESVALQADGRIVAAGNVGLARYNADGSFDASFNASGSQPGTIAAGNYEHYFNDVTVQSDGKIVAGGMKQGANDLDFLVSRYTAAGIPDATFGVNGEVTVNFQGGPHGGHDRIEALAIQPDGKIVAVGTARSDLSITQWVVMRFLPNGGLDTVVLQPDGKILVAGTVTSETGTQLDFAVA